ncbi:carbonic anhydrase [Aspergillus spectabilis]
MRLLSYTLPPGGDTSSSYGSTVSPIYLHTFLTKCPSQKSSQFQSWKPPPKSNLLPSRQPPPSHQSLGPDIEDPTLFPRLADNQSPDILWIGCSDSRCPETTLLHLHPGDIFVERNIANILHPSDPNALAVIEYAVLNPKVQLIILCGHKACGGVEAILDDQELTLGLELWLEPLKQVREEHRLELDSLTRERAAVRLAELNVFAGVRALQELEFVKEAMRDGLKVYGLFYNVGDGMLRELLRV